MNRYDPTPLESVAWWAEEAESAHGERDNAIRYAVDAGHTLREIAEASGLTHAGIAYILKKGTKT